MTTPDDAQALLPVTQADRDAAGQVDPANRVDYKLGRMDGSSNVQAFARHRISHSLPGDVGTVRADLEDLLEDIEDEWIDHYLRPDSAERAKCKRCGGDDFFKSSIEHKPGCLVGRIRAALAALTPSALPREERMVTIERDGEGKPTVWCDPEIADLVTALNAAGLKTVASCSGHGHRPGRISLTDGREFIIARDFDEAARIEAMFPLDINGEPIASALSGDAGGKDG